jgi:hypothetical protein
MAFFMLSFLNYPKVHIMSHEDNEQHRILLQQRGAIDQLLICATGPWDSDKDFVSL